MIGFQNRISFEELSKRLLLEETKKGKGKAPVHAMKAYRGQMYRKVQLSLGNEIQYHEVVAFPKQ